MATQYHHGKFPPNNLNWERLLPLIGPAQAAVARYEGILHSIPDSKILLSPLVTQEAVLSSKIEGTQATIGDVLKYEASEDTATGEKKKDIQEILNYRSALYHAVELMKTLPLSQRVVRETHSVLMQGVRGKNKTPGDYRRNQNWIGPEGEAIELAKFIPPGAEKLADLMTCWEKHLHQEPKDTLVQLAILHAEFESIHPFLDGNGRLGRLLVPLFLVAKDLLTGPNFYISTYLEANREQYYERLLAVSREDDWTGWCEFFLIALMHQAKQNEVQVKKILELYRIKKEWIVKETRSPHAVQALDWFFGKPGFRTSQFIKETRIPEPTARRILSVITKGGLLRVLIPGKGRQSNVYIFPDLINIVENRIVF